MNLVNIKQTTLETHTDQMTSHYLTHQQYRTTPWTDDTLLQALLTHLILLDTPTATDYTICNMQC